MFFPLCACVCQPIFTSLPMTDKLFFSLILPMLFTSRHSYIPSSSNRASVTSSSKFSVIVILPSVVLLTTAGRENGDVDTHWRWMKSVALQEKLKDPPTFTVALALVEYTWIGREKWAETELVTDSLPTTENRENDQLFQS